MIFNESLDRRDVLDDYRQANIFLVFKTGEKYDTACYMPVSLTYICYKTLEHIRNVLVSKYDRQLAFDSILAGCQHDFQSQGSCETELDKVVHDITSNGDGVMNRAHKQTFDHI